MMSYGDEAIGGWVAHDLSSLRRAIGGLLGRFSGPGAISSSAIQATVAVAVEHGAAAGGTVGEAQASGSTEPQTADDRPASRAPAFGFPIMLEVRDQVVLVVGGGREPAHKAAALAALGARVIVSAVEHTETLQLAGMAGVELRKGPFDPALLDDARLAIVATGDRALDREIATLARSRRVLVNTVDDIPFCDWSAPAILRRGDLTVSFATAGIAPALAVRLRDRLADEVGPEYAELLEIFGEVRPRIMASGRSFGSRRRLWYSLVDGPALEALKAGDRAGAEQAVGSAIAAWEATA